jgi:hypothetical protein
VHGRSSYVEIVIYHTLSRRARRKQVVESIPESELETAGCEEDGCRSGRVAPQSVPGDEQVSRPVLEEDFEERRGLPEVLRRLGLLGNGSAAGDPELVERIAGGIGNVRQDAGTRRDHRLGGALDQEVEESQRMGRHAQGGQENRGLGVLPHERREEVDPEFAAADLE